MTALRLGVIGLGMAGAMMVRAAARHDGVVLAAAADPHAGPRDAFARDFNARAYADASALVEDKAVEAVYVATPHQFHADHAIMAAARGKHVILEKPMALTLADCDRIIAAVERAKVQLIVGHTHAFDPAVRAMRGLIASGELGALGMLASWNYTNYLYRPRRPEELDTSKGGGILFNQVPHQIDTIRLLGGGLVRSVRAQVGVLDPARPTEANCAAFLEFADGVPATLVYSGYDFFDTDELHFWISERGSPKEPAHGAARRALGARTGEEAGLRTLTAGYGSKDEASRRTSRISASPSRPARAAICAPRRTASSSMGRTESASSGCPAAEGIPVAITCSTTCAPRSRPAAVRCMTAAGARPPSRLRWPSSNPRANAARSHWFIRWPCQGSASARSFLRKRAAGRTGASTCARWRDGKVSRTFSAGGLIAIALKRSPIQGMYSSI